jgi:hypothetical protein
MFEAQNTWQKLKAREAKGNKIILASIPWIQSSLYTQGKVLGLTEHHLIEVE